MLSQLVIAAAAAMQQGWLLLLLLLPVLQAMCMWCSESH
jgi:uncharacterized membrane protein